MRDRGVFRDEWHNVTRGGGTPGHGVSCWKCVTNFGKIIFITLFLLLFLLLSFILNMPQRLGIPKFFKNVS